MVVIYLKVLHFYRTYFPATQGGLEEAIRQICKSTQKLGVESRVLTLAPVHQPQVVKLPEADVFQFPLQWELASCSMGMSLFSAYRQIGRWADVVNVHYPWPFADVVHLASGLRKPVCLTYHSDIIRQRKLNLLYTPLRRLFFSRVSRIVATSPNYLDSSPVLRHYREKTVTIPLGLDPETLPSVSDADVESVKRKFGQSFFLFIGVLRHYKGLDYLLEAARISGLSVVIAGKGPEEKALKDKAEAHGLTNLMFAGFVSDTEKVSLIRACRAIVFPSHLRSEAFGLTLLEGAALGKPLISCELGTGTSFINIHEKTGLVVPPSDPRALSVAMRQIADDSNASAKYASAAKERFETCFSADRLGENYRSLYEELGKE